MTTLVAVAVFGTMALEAWRARRNETAQRARGGTQPSGDVAVYKMMRIAYPLAFIAMIVECAIRGHPSTTIVTAGMLLFALAKALKWWAIATLGPAWTFRVIVVPGSALVATGPYRWVRHPNYVAVAGELVSVALMTGAAIAGPIGTALFAALILRRIAVEERALGLESRADAGAVSG